MSKLASIGEYQQINTPVIKGSLHKCLTLNYQSINAFSDINSLFQDLKSIKQERDRETFIATDKNNRQLFCKLYSDRGSLSWIKRNTKGSKANIGHKKSISFLETGLQSPLSLGYLEESGLLTTKRSLQIFEFVTDAKTLKDYLPDNISEQERISHILTKLAVDLACLHKEGLIHGDMKLTNVMISDNNLLLVDLDSYKPANNKYTPARDIARCLVGLSEVDVDQRIISDFVDQYISESNSDRNVFFEQLNQLIVQFQQHHSIKYGREPKAINLN